MSEKKKTIIEDILLEAKAIENGLQENAKELFRLNIKEEINGMVKDSLTEEEEAIEEGKKESKPFATKKSIKGLKTEQESEEAKDNDFATDDETSPEGDTDGAADNMDGDTGEFGGEPDAEGEPEMDADSEGGSTSDEFSTMGDETDADAEGGEFGDEKGLGDDEEGDVEDLTDADDEGAFKVYKELSDSDEVQVVPDEDGKGFTLNDEANGVSYKVQMNEDEEYIFEIELDEEFGDYGDDNYGDDNGEESQYDAILAKHGLLDSPKNLGGKSNDQSYFNNAGEEEEDTYDQPDATGNDDEMMEAQGQRTKARLRQHSPRHGEMEKKYAMNEDEYKKVQKIIAENKKLKELNAVLENAKVELTESIDEYKKAVSIQRQKMDNLALFSENVFNCNKLFVQNSTTKEEKESIFERFDGVKTIKESKELYKIIKDELSSTNVVNENVIASTPKAGSTNINESKVYVDPKLQRIHELMNYKRR